MGDHDGRGSGIGLLELSIDRLVCQSIKIEADDNGLTGGGPIRRPIMNDSRFRFQNGLSPDVTGKLIQKKIASEPRPYFSKIGRRSVLVINFTMRILQKAKRHRCQCTRTLSPA